ncbi:ComF family protein [Sansalvadorimonas sp. 2012CJ34-2]|uniref:ComF family protein n=1 Tax=Parendozoicomonas callyspongiae TaxID=2942213 RepID=A0ABT0PIZ2_9GAMM|nr:ComF family protein [Sansalvadorimonas sp. 2012CJ34-2]MCL6271201.1 ComF family protein [Sansalvadorimonas sp. 2012CJ34-2]
MPEANSLFCRQCQKYERPFNDCIIPFTYEPPVSNMLKQLKYGGRLIYLRPLVSRLADSLENHYQDKEWPQAIIPVPLHWWRLRKRGFNQSNLIARSISKTTGIPVLSNCIKKRRATPQRGLALSERKRNTKNIFSLKRAPGVKHVAIVDDVMTTGSTVEELCRTLKKTGVQTLDIWCLVRTPAHYTV